MVLRPHRQQLVLLLSRKLHKRHLRVEVFQAGRSIQLVVMLRALPFLTLAAF